ncbi:MAG: 4Fe-4S dicluster domain-containing protein [Planctomycetota bacterium]|jgi:ferredoxin-type protein NapG
MASDNAHSSDRRGFFRDALRQAVTPLADYLDGRVESPSPGHMRLRPPGAVEESRFLDTCQRCGACVEVCPALAIFPLDQTRDDAAGTPVIDPDQAACVVCEGLKCTHACPSGALLPIHDKNTIRMGLAELYEPLCERTQGEPCTLCVDRCPLGETAIRLTGHGSPEVLVSGCVGCGVCQLYCPTTPKAIMVKPLWGREEQ